MTPRSVQFRREREASWRLLEEILARAERRGVRALTVEELGLLPQLYRAAVSSLSVARAVSLDAALLAYLEALAARAYIQVYGAKSGFFESVADFVLRGLPRAVRSQWLCFAFACLTFLIGTTAGFFLVLEDPVRYFSIMDMDLAGGRSPDSTTEELRRVLYSGDDHSSGSLAQFSAFLFSNNARVGLLAFALGFVVGVPTIFLLFQNGLMLGALAAVYHQRGLSLRFWGWILPHGVTEILAIILCGAAGLVVARHIVFPGRLSRRDNLMRHGRSAGVIVVGCVVLFFIAGQIEGIFRQRVQSDVARWAVATVTAVNWLLYFTWSGRRRA